jgi:hypothetical protein
MAMTSRSAAAVQPFIRRLAKAVRYLVVFEFSDIVACELPAPALFAQI